MPLPSNIPRMSSLLIYPSYEIRTKKIAGRTQVFDFIRRKWLALSPEEWVRQHLIHHLVHERKIPASLISIEKEIILNGTRKRYDVVVYDRGMKPWMIAECKAPYVTVDNSVAEQALRYNLTLSASYLLLTNGVTERVFDAGRREVSFPEFTLAL
jgi:hypothetical protein